MELTGLLSVAVLLVQVVIQYSKKIAEQLLLRPTQKIRRTAKRSARPDISTLGAGIGNIKSVMHHGCGKFVTRARRSLLSLLQPWPGAVYALAWIDQHAGNFLCMEPPAGEVCAVLRQTGEQGLIAAGAGFDFAFGAVQRGHLCQGHAE